MKVLEMKYLLMIATCGFVATSVIDPAIAQTQTASKPPVTTFFHTLNDVPVMPGLRELPDKSLNFDKPEGRIMAVTAVSDTVKPPAIRSFYAQTLPQLGWSAQTDGSFVRDQERLKLIIEASEGVSITRLQVEPR